jgi:hypothetical protein
VGVGQFGWSKNERLSLRGRWGGGTIGKKEEVTLGHPRKLNSLHELELSALTANVYGIRSSS